MVLCLAPTHPLLDKERGVVINNVEFQIGKLDRSSNVVSGKFKSIIIIFSYCNYVS